MLHVDWYGYSGIRYVTGNNVALRDTPGLSSNVLIRLNKGAALNRLGTEEVRDGHNWVRVRYAGHTIGWMSSTYLTSGSVAPPPSPHLSTPTQETPKNNSELSEPEKEKLPANFFYTGSSIGDGSWILDAIRLLSNNIKLKATPETRIAYVEGLGVKVEIFYGLEFQTNPDGFWEYICNIGWSFYSAPVELFGTTIQSSASPDGALALELKTGLFSAEFGTNFTETHSQLSLKVGFSTPSNSFSTYLKVVVEVHHITTISVVTLAALTQGASIVPTIKAYTAASAELLAVIATMAGKLVIAR